MGVSINTTLPSVVFVEAVSVSKDLDLLGEHPGNSSKLLSCDGEAVLECVGSVFSNLDVSADADGSL